MISEIKKTDKKSKNWLMFFVIIDVMTVVFIFIMTFVGFMINNEVFTVSILIMLLLAGGIYIQLVVIAKLFEKRNEYRECEELTKRYLREQKEHFEYLKAREEVTRKFKEEIGGHISNMYKMLRGEKFDEFDKYLEQLDMKMDSFGNVVTVHNGIVDAILNQYYAKAKKQGINMTIKGQMPGDCHIAAYDLCSVFSNMLSNAFEAAMDSEERRVGIDCRHTEKNIIIVVRNSYRGIRSLKTGKLETGKDDRHYHGLGMENIRDSVKRYNGTMDIDIRGSEFILTILMDYRKEME